MKIRFISLSIICFILASCNLKAQNDTSSLNNEEKQHVVNSIIELLNNNYVFPEVAKDMSDLILKNFNSGKYEKISNPREFSIELTQDLISVSKDKHVRVIFDPEKVQEMRQTRGSEERSSLLTSQREYMKRENYGFKEVRMLDQNIGYINLTNFFDAGHAGEAAIKAMKEVSSAKVLIIDLRYNGGGSPSMIQLITSYFFEGEPVHLNTFYWRPADRYTETWTLPEVKGKRMPNTDIYILTSDRTFSAAEEFSYNLKNLKRATLIGETTGGGAHPGGERIAGDRFLIWLPSGRAINPITNTNWEGTGVEPHIHTSEEMALKIALDKAKEKIGGY